jgi:Aromatic-ring-opening dioxygenase LigAB, LigA subunit
MARNWQQSMPDTQAYWIDRVLFDVQHDAEEMQRFNADALAYMADLPLSEAIKKLLRGNDIGQLYLAGANPYLLRAHCLGLHIPEHEYLAALRAVAKESGNG